MSDWYKTGEDADKAIEEEAVRQEEARKSGGKLQRYWMPPNNKQGDQQHYLTFLDGLTHPEGFSSPFTFMEHQLKLNGHWRNWFTCIEGLVIDGKKQSCPLCAAGENPSLMAAYSVIDHTEFTDKKGNTRSKEVRLFVCKSQVQGALKKAAKKKKGLRGWHVEVTRTGSDAASTGNSFDFEERFDEEEFQKKFGVELPQPPDYREIFAPMKPEELEAKIAGRNVDVEGEERIRY